MTFFRSKKKTGLVVSASLREEVAIRSIRQVVQAAFMKVIARNGVRILDRVRKRQMRERLLLNSDSSLSKQGSLTGKGFFNLSGVS